jgi:phosphoglycerate dehydrogenase-like enzyme
VNAAPLRILLSAAAADQLRDRIAAALTGHAHVLVLAQEREPGDDADLAFLSREVTGLSTKHEILPATERFYEALRRAPSLRWVQVHSAGADRAIFGELRSRGVQVTTASGANAGVVAQSALALMLALARHLPQQLAAQRERRWAPLLDSGLPRDMAGQGVVLVGWGPIGQRIGALVQALGLRLSVVRQSAAPAGAGIATVGYDALAGVLPQADWLVLACPLSARTRGLVGARELACLPRGARVVNVARGELVDEAALIEALRSGALGGAALDVFAHEPLPPDSPLWTLDKVIVTPHSAGFSDGNEARVAEIFLDNLRRWIAGEPLRNRSAGGG